MKTLMNTYIQQLNMIWCLCLKSRLHTLTYLSPRIKMFKMFQIRRSSALLNLLCYKLGFKNGRTSTFKYIDIITIKRTRY